MDGGNDENARLTEINVEAVPMGENEGTAILVAGIIPEATEELIQALLGYCINSAHGYGIDIEALFKDQMELNTPRDPSTLH